MTSELSRFAYTACNRVMQGLGQELKIQPYYHYEPAGHNAARVLSLRLVSINPHYLPKILSLRDQLTMWAGLDDRHPVRIGWDGKGVTIEIPKPPKFWQKVTIEHLQAHRYLRRGAVATLGVGIQDEPRRINFQEVSTNHVLITGLTQSGKTNTQRLIAWNLAHNAPAEAARLLIFDVAKKGHRWKDFVNVEHLIHPLITHLEEAERVLHWLVQEIERRGEQGQFAPRLFIVIDELKALIDDSMVARDHIARVASAGAEFGLHLVMATQYPQIKMLGNAEIKRNVSTRLCGKVDSADSAANALGIPDTGAESLQGYGDFLLLDYTGLFRLTVAKLEEKHVNTLPRASPQSLDLPPPDEVATGVRSSPKKPGKPPDLLTPEEVGLALFEPMGINKLARRLGIGSSKAQRALKFAQDIREWALAQGFRQLDLEEPEAQPQYRNGIIACWPDNGAKHKSANLRVVNGKLVTSTSLRTEASS